MPLSRVFLTANWRYLSMLNYEIDPAVLQPYVPRGTELDSWDGRTFVSLVGFLFLDTRVMGLPIPFHRSFEEVNLRFYVRYRAGDELRRGVVFIKEIVPRQAIALTARYAYNENYVALPMRHVLKLEAGGEVGGAMYAWRYRGEEMSIEVETEGGPEPLVPGSEPEFIAQHYWGYCVQRNGGTVEYEVAHPPWRVWQCRSGRFKGDAAGFYGARFADTLGSEPSSVFLAEGSKIAVHRGRRIV